MLQVYCSWNIHYSNTTESIFFSNCFVITKTWKNITIKFCTSFSTWYGCVWLTVVLRSWCTVMLTILGFDVDHLQFTVKHSDINVYPQTVLHFCSYKRLYFWNDSNKRANQRHFTAVNIAISFLACITFWPISRPCSSSAYKYYTYILFYIYERWHAINAIASSFLYGSILKHVFFNIDVMSGYFKDLIAVT